MVNAVLGRTSTSPYTRNLSTYTHTVAACRAVLTGKHGTLERRAPGWQGAPDDQQAKN